MSAARLTVLALLASAVVSSAAVAKIPDPWDGLTKVESKRLQAVFLLPTADFRGYNKVLIDRPEIAFRKDWQKDHNRTQMSVSQRVDDEDVRKAIDRASDSFAAILERAYTNAGYQVVTEPGADVLRIRTGVVNIVVNAPDVMSAGRSRTFTTETGEATLIVEARDSVSGTLMGRAVDRSIVGDTFRIQWANSVSNRAEFEDVFRRWAKASAEGMAKLKALSSPAR